MRMFHCLQDICYIDIFKSTKQQENIILHDSNTTPRYLFLFYTNFCLKDCVGFQYIYIYT